MVTVSLCLTDQPRGHPREEGVLRAGRRVHRAVMVAVMDAVMEDIVCDEGLMVTVSLCVPDQLCGHRVVM